MMDKFICQRQAGQASIWKERYHGGGIWRRLKCAHRGRRVIVQAESDGTFEELDDNPGLEDTWNPKKKGRPWHKYMKSTRQLNKLKDLMPTDFDLFEENSAEVLSTNGNVENRSFEIDVENSGLAYLAKGGKVQDVNAMLRSLGWDYLVTEETDEAVDDEDELSEQYPWGKPIPKAGQDRADESYNIEEDADDTLRGEWDEYETQELAKPVEEKLLEKAMYASAMRLIETQEMESQRRAQVSWYLKDKFNSEFVLANYLAHMARERQDDRDGLEIVNYKETGTFFSKYRPLITSKALFDLESSLKNEEVSIDDINENQSYSDRKYDLLEKSIAYLCRRAINVEVANHIKRNLSFKNDQMKLDPWERLDLDNLEENLGIEHVEDVIVDGSSESEEADIEEYTALDSLLEADSENYPCEDLKDVGYTPSSRNFAPTVKSDFFPEIKEDSIIRLQVDGETVEIELNKIGNQAQWIKQLLGYKETDKELMENYHKIMARVEENFQVRSKEKKGKKKPRKFRKELSENNGNAPWHLNEEEVSESELFQDAVDIFDQSEDSSTLI